MFHALHKVDMRACNAKQKINLACPNVHISNDISRWIFIPVYPYGRSNFGTQKSTYFFLDTDIFSYIFTMLVVFKNENILYPLETF